MTIAELEAGRRRASCRRFVAALVTLLLTMAALALVMS